MKFFQDILNEDILEISEVHGGSINESFYVKTTTSGYFIKRNASGVFEGGFESEIHGLNFLKNAGAPVPHVVNHGQHMEIDYLVLEYLQPTSSTKHLQVELAENLVRLHRQSNAQFGLDRDNYMGSLSQNNTWRDDFITFFVENRLVPQARLAREKGLLNSDLISKLESLYKQLDSILPEEQPSAIHGDLWGGNAHYSIQGSYFIDPAVAYSHREIDLAMTFLFGGFSSEFYETYENLYPLQPGFGSRIGIYNLYPLLIHLNLFGKGYLSSIEGILKSF